MGRQWETTPAKNFPKKISTVKRIFSTVIAKAWNRVWHLKIDNKNQKLNQVRYYLSGQTHCETTYIGSELGTKISKQITK